MIAAEADEVQIVSAMPAFRTRRHTSSVEVVVPSRVSNSLRDPGRPLFNSFFCMDQPSSGLESQLLEKYMLVRFAPSGASAQLSLWQAIL